MSRRQAIKDLWEKSELKTDNSKINAIAKEIGIYPSQVKQELARMKLIKKSRKKRRITGDRNGTQPKTGSDGAQTGGDDGLPPAPAIQNVEGIKMDKIKCKNAGNGCQVELTDIKAIELHQKYCPHNQAPSLGPAPGPVDIPETPAGPEGTPKDAGPVPKQVEAPAPEPAPEPVKKKDGAPMPPQDVIVGVSQGLPMMPANILNGLQDTYEFHGPPKTPDWDWFWKASDWVMGQMLQDWAKWLPAVMFVYGMALCYMAQIPDAFKAFKAKHATATPESAKRIEQDTPEKPQTPKKAAIKQSDGMGLSAPPEFRAPGEAMA